ncbi:MAG: hypothetical protein M0C28_19675 [Candidatus Moduliflexus flocculans]|nr:hypothetical protein [Candidatus Moduliflexus flocculans]MCK7580547.1 hypothetical protein [Chromatiales bacterium]
MSGGVVVGICALFFMAVQWLGPNADSLIARAFPSPTPRAFPPARPRQRGHLSQI